MRDEKQPVTDPRWVPCCVPGARFFLQRRRVESPLQKTWCPVPSKGRTGQERADVAPFNFLQRAGMCYVNSFGQQAPCFRDGDVTFGFRIHGKGWPSQTHDMTCARRYLDEILRGIPKHFHSKRGNVACERCTEDG